VLVCTNITKALGEKQQSSIALGFYYLAQERLSISAGNTGAMLVGAV
jgi:glycerol-3-phosphate acyltransferase PlsX